MLNFFFNFIKGKNKVNPLIRELIDFTKLQDPESFKVMDILPELSKLEPTDADLDALEKAFDERNLWAPLNRDFWEKIISDLLKENGRDIEN